MNGLERGNVELAPYRPEWKQQYEAEVERLEGIASDSLHEFEHIGSTAIEGMAAKPIIDLLTVVDDVDETGELIDLLETHTTNIDQMVYRYSKRRDRGPNTTKHEIDNLADCLSRCLHRLGEEEATTDLSNLET